MDGYGLHVEKKYKKSNKTEAKSGYKNQIGSKQEMKGLKVLNK